MSITDGKSVKLYTHKGDRIGVRVHSNGYVLTINEHPVSEKDMRLKNGQEVVTDCLQEVREVALRAGWKYTAQLTTV